LDELTVVLNVALRSARFIPISKREHFTTGFIQFGSLVLMVSSYLHGTSTLVQTFLEVALVALEAKTLAPVLQISVPFAIGSFTRTVISNNLNSALYGRLPTGMVMYPLAATLISFGDTISRFFRSI